MSQGRFCNAHCAPGRSFFVLPCSLEELAIRLRRRGTDSEESIGTIGSAAEELQALKNYRYEIINREVEQSVAEYVTF